MFHVTLQLQDSTVSETVVDEAGALAIFATAQNNPSAMICNAFNQALGTWLYFFQVPPSVMALDKDGIQVLPERQEEEAAPLVTATTSDGAEVSGFVLASLPIAGDAALWFQTVEGDLLTILGSQILANGVAVNPRAVVYSQELGNGKAARNCAKLGQITAYLEDGELTGQRVTVLSEYPEPFVQILDAENVVWVVYPDALEPAPEPEPVPSVQTPATAQESAGASEAGENSTRVLVLERRDLLLIAAGTVGDHATTKEEVAEARRDLLQSLAMLTEPWPLVSDICRDIVLNSPDPVAVVTDEVAEIWPAGLSYFVSDIEKATQKAVEDSHAPDAPTQAKAKGRGPTAKKQGAAAKKDS